MKLKATVLGALALLGALAAAPAEATFYQPFSHEQLAGPSARTSDPVGGSYDAALYISAVNPAFADPLESAPDDFTWTGGAHPAGTNLLSGASMTIVESYLPGVGPNGGDVIQVNIYSANGSPLVPPGSELNGRPVDTLQMHVGAGLKTNPIDTDTPQAILSSGMAVFQDGAMVGGAIALTTQVDVGGVGYYAPGGPIDGAGIDEAAMFWELTPEPASLSILAVGGMLAARRRRS